MKRRGRFLEHPAHGLVAGRHIGPEPLDPALLSFVTRLNEMIDSIANLNIVSFYVPAATHFCFTRFCQAEER